MPVTGIHFYTDVITYHPYEEEQDLNDTLELLLQAPRAFSLCVNKLFVLPGIPLAGHMLRDGKSLQVEDGRQSLFDLYCRLFWIASYSPFSTPLVRYLQSRSFFRRKPQLISLRLAKWGLERFRLARGLFYKRIWKALCIAYGFVAGHVHASVIRARIAAVWILRRTVNRAFPRLIRFRSDRERVRPAGT